MHTNAGFTLEMHAPCMQAARRTHDKMHTNKRKKWYIKSSLQSVNRRRIIVTWAYHHSRCV